MPIVKTFEEPVVEPPLAKIEVPGVNSATGEESGFVFEVESGGWGRPDVDVCAHISSRSISGRSVNSFVTVEQARALAGALNEFADRAEVSA